MKSRKTLPLLLSLLWNYALLFVLYMLCRVVYVAEFWDLYSTGWESLSIEKLLRGSLLFDLSAICYTTGIYGVLMLLPIASKVRYSVGWQQVCKIVYVLVNIVMLWSNLMDTIYSRYAGRRTTGTFLTEFKNEGNLGDVVGVELLNHWYLVLVAVAFVVALIMLYRPASRKHRRPSTWRYYVSSTAVLLFYIGVCFVGLRGGINSHRPLSLADANRYVNQPKEANIVLNTPFSFLRTLGKATFVDPQYYTSNELDRIYSPIHEGNPFTDSLGAVLPDSLVNKKNVVLIILESFGTEYFGAFNVYDGYTPFLDQLIDSSLTFDRSYANGRKSIDAMPSVLSSVPMMVEPFILTRYALNRVSSMAGHLGRWGYRTAFFHNCENQSMGFQSYARSVGYQSYYGIDEYCADGRFGGMNDYDGTWGIWDEEFMQYFATMMDTLPQPFLTTLFTASSHHPFAVPNRYNSRLAEGPLKIHKTIRYTDYALRRFFETVSQLPWYENTLFVLVADHTNRLGEDSYKTSAGVFRVPIIFFDPSRQMPRGRSQSVAQQIDIMPTVLNFLHYPNRYLAFGQDLLATPASETWAFNYLNNTYQLVVGDWLLLFDGHRVTALYNLEQDPMQKNNRINDKQMKLFADHQTRRLKALIQSYMQRMISDRLVME